jgi:hypothetical protein
MIADEELQGEGQQDPIEAFLKAAVDFAGDTVDCKIVGINPDGVSTLEEFTKQAIESARDILGEQEFAVLRERAIRKFGFKGVLDYLNAQQLGLHEVMTAQSEAGKEESSLTIIQNAEVEREAIVLGLLAADELFAIAQRGVAARHPYNAIDLGRLRRDVSARIASDSPYSHALN